ncbi:XRE family transcriptional regulator [Streptomyces sp. bgisy084]|uniref:XRE family transcriptional regulator n=1 Tax=Streptomyces sp. bgisy084 TaxID=3413777 RepID=UPI003D70C801
MDDGLGIGELLVRLRHARGSVTQAKIAAEYNEVEGSSVPTMTGKEIGRYEREVRLPSERTRGFLARVFGVDSAMLDQAHAVSRRRKADERGKAAPSDSTAVMATARRAALPPSSCELAADAARSARFARLIALTNSDASTVEQLDADVARLARHFVSRPLKELYAEIRELRDETFELLRGRQRPQQTSDLLVTASRLCGLSAHVCLDAGDYDSAGSHARTAWSCAEAAGHHEMQAWVRSVESLIAFWNGNPQRAADLARHGQRYSASGSVGVRLASLEARALAVAGDAQGAVAALMTAEQARDAMQGPDVMPGVFGFPPAKQFTYAGTTHLAIGGPGHVQQAIDCAGTAVDLYGMAAAEDRSTFDLLAANLDLARGHLLAGEADATEVLLGAVLDSGPGQLSASILNRLGALAGELGAAQYRGSPGIAHLRERIVNAAMPAALSAADSSEPLT